MFGERLHTIRKSKGFTAQYMADQLNTGIRNYRKYESGHANPTLEGLVKIADLLNVSTDFLLCRDDFLKSLGVSSDECEKDLPTCPKA